MLGYMVGIQYLYYVINDKSMKLIERMSSENVERIVKFSEVYPSLGGALLKELGEFEYWHYLTYELSLIHISEPTRH